MAWGAGRGKGDAVGLREMVKDEVMSRMTESDRNDVELWEPDVSSLIAEELERFLGELADDASLLVLNKSYGL